MYIFSLITVILHNVHLHFINIIKGCDYYIFIIGARDLVHLCIVVCKICYWHFA